MSPVLSWIKKHPVWASVIGVLILSAIVGPISDANAKKTGNVAAASSPTSPTSSSPAAAASTTAPPSPSPAKSSPAAVPSAAAAAPPPAVPVDALTGFGALASTWDAHHTADTSYNPGSAFDPDPNLPQANGRTGDRYVMVQYAEGYVTSFQVNEPSGTSVAAAMRDIVGRDMPPDTKVLWTRDQSSDGCFQEEVASAALGRALRGGGLADSQGAVLLEAQSQDISVFDASNVAWVMVNTGDGSLTAADAPGC